MLFALLASLFSCSNKEVEKSDDIILSSNYASPGDTITLVTDSRYKLYQQPDTAITYISKKGKFNDTLDIPKGYYELSAPNKTIRLYLEPGYDLHIKQSNDTLVIEGKGENENRFIQKRFKMLADLGGKNYPRSYYLKLKEDRFLKFVDSIEKSRLTLIETSNLESEFKSLETNREKIEKANKLLTYSFGRKHIDSAYAQSADYPDSMEGIDPNNPALLDIDLFRIFMFVYSGPKSEEANMERWEYILSDEFPSSNEDIRQEVFYTNAIFDMPSIKKLDEFYVASQKFIESPEKKKEIGQKYFNVKGLTKGKEAPQFELKNIQGNPVSLDDLKGNLVYLDIWTTSCGPCLQAMPDMKKLQDEYSDRKIKFVSLNVESKKERVVDILEKNNLGGIKLYDPAKDQEIKQKYAVTSFPRYVLIDKEGKIIDHMAKRPSDPKLKSQLQSLLN